MASLNVISNTALTIWSGCSLFFLLKMYAWASTWCSHEPGLEVWRRMKLGYGQVSYLPSAFVVAHLGSKSHNSSHCLPWCGATVFKEYRKMLLSVGLWVTWLMSLTRHSCLLLGLEEWMARIQTALLWQCCAGELKFFESLLLAWLIKCTKWLNYKWCQEPWCDLQYLCPSSLWVAWTLCSAALNQQES